MNLALFDFDGTITNKDSLEEFIKFARGSSRYYAGLLYLAPMLVLYKLHVIPNHRAKEIFLSHYFKDVSEREFERLGEEYALTQINKIVRPKAIKAINEHQKNGDAVTIVSASINLWLKAWCQKRNITLIATELEFENGVFNGRFKGHNCYGPEKAKRVKALYKLDVFKTIYAYGDSSGDRELLKLADRSFYKPFR
ncbi:MAG: HAD family hydrolase [Campylobacterota bacterium]|nr:HAD family hydrolase [Campylobacterota bacterium]